MNNLLYVCSPYRGTPEQIKRNKEYARELTRAAILNGFIPVTVHLYLTEALDDTIEEEREVGVEAGKEILKHCKYMLCGTRYGISEGMTAEMELGQQLGIIKLTENRGKIFTT